MCKRDQADGEDGDAMSEQRFRHVRASVGWRSIVGGRLDDPSIGTMIDSGSASSAAGTATGEVS